MCKVSPVFKQFLAIACCNILTFAYGLGTGWATINQLELESESTTFSTGQLTEQESSLVVSVLFIGGLCGNYIILPLSRMFGIKRTLHFLGIPLTLSAILTIWAQNSYFLYASRILTGLAGGGLVVGIPMFVNDISFDSVRGALNSLYDPFNNLGMIVSFLIGNYLSLVDQAKMQLIPPAIFMMMVFFLPESPEFLNSQNKIKRANKSHQFYKGSITMNEKPDKSDFMPVPQNEENVEKMEKIDQIEKGNKKIFDSEIESNSALALGDFFTPHARKAIFISFTSLTLAYLSGTLSIINFVTFIFKETGSSFSEKDSSLLISVIQLTANLVLLNIIERYNRRTLYIWSSLLTTASYFLFAAYGHLWYKQPGYEWMPPFCFACVVYFSCMGMRPIPYIITMEIFPKKIRKTCLAMAVSMLWLILFVVGAVFHPCIELLGFFNFMIVLGFISLLNALFGIFFVPETRGKSYEEIMNALIK